LNGYVTTATAGSRAASGLSVERTPVAALDEQLSRAAAAHSLSASVRTPQDEVALAAERAKALSDAWLKELEERAKQQWQQLVGGK
jgi:hypothetical protein